MTTDIQANERLGLRVVSPVARFGSRALNIFLSLGLFACQLDDRKVVCDSDCQRAELGAEGGTVNAAGGSPSKGGAVGDGKGGTSTPTGGRATSNGGESAGGTSGAARGGSGSKGGTTAAGGTRAAGGTTMAGGSTAVGGATQVWLTDCRNSVGKGDDGRIDDFDDRDLFMTPVDGRQGYWNHLRMDNMGSAPLVSAGYLSVRGDVVPGDTVNIAWASVKSDLRSIGGETTPQSCVYDASKYRGVRFRARGTPIRLSLEMDLNVPKNNTYGAPGACAAEKETDCYARYSADAALTQAWQDFEFNWAQLSPSFQATWKPAFEPTRLLAIYFELQANAEGEIPMYAFELDDVEFMD